MFGQNKPVKASYRGSHLQVKEIFETIQGEGPYTGRPAYFIRLSNCSLKCFYCDTDFTGGNLMSVEQIMGCLPNRYPFVVLTGGEPMIQNIAPLIRKLHDQWGTEIQVETCGSHCAPDLPWYTRVVCSPKTPTVARMISDFCFHWKYVIAADDELDERGIPITNTQRPGGPKAPLYYPINHSHAQIWLQPRDDQDDERNEQNAQRCLSLLRRFPHYRLSLQTHKVLGLP